MEKEIKKIDFKIRSGLDSGVVFEGIETSSKPFGEIVIKKAGRGQKLKIKGLQQIDVSNKYGAVFCCNEKELKVFFGPQLSLEAKIEFEQEIQCLKVSQYDEQFIAIGFEGELRIYDLIGFVQSQLKSKRFTSIQLNGRFNQIQWNKQENNHLLLRSTETRDTFFIKFDTKEINEDLGQTEAICFDLNNNIVSVKDGELILFPDLDIYSPEPSSLTASLPYSLSRMFHIEEYEPNQWLFIGFNRNEVENKEDESDIDGMVAEFFTSKGDIKVLIENKNPLKIKEAAYTVSGSISEFVKYIDFLEFKLVKVADQTYCLFSSVSEQSMLISSQIKGEYFTENIEEKISKYKGQVRGACFATFQIAKDEGFIQFIGSDNISYYQSIPPCVITLDVEMNLRKHFVCQHLTNDEKQKNMPKNLTSKSQILEISDVDDDVDVVDNNVEEQQKQVKIEEKIPIVNAKEDINEIKNLPPKEEKVLEVIEKQLINQVPCPFSVANNEQKMEIEQPCIEPLNHPLQVKSENEVKESQFNKDQEMEIQKEEAKKTLGGGSCNVPQNQQDHMMIPNSINEPQINQELENMKEKVEEIDPYNIKYTKDTVKQYLENFSKYQSEATKLIYSEERSVYNSTNDQNFNKKYQYTEFSDLRLDFHTIMSQQSIHSFEYYFEQDKIIFCSNEADGLSYIYALSLEQYSVLCQKIESLGQEYKKMIQKCTLSRKEKIIFSNNKLKEAQDDILKDLKQFQVLNSNQPIIQIHLIYSYFIAIVFKDGLCVRSLNAIVQNEQNSIPHIVSAPKQFPFTVQQLIFSRSKKYFLVLTNEKEVFVMNTLSQEILYSRKGGVLFANFAYQDDNEIYILEDDITLKINIKSKHEEKFNQYGNKLEHGVIHFEEYKPGNFISIQYSIKISNPDCTDCKQNGCKKCRENAVSVYQSNDLNNAILLNLGDYSHQWDYIQYVNSNSAAKCFYNPLIKQLLTVINLMGTIHVLNVSDDNQSTDPCTNVPNWQLKQDTLITGVIFMPTKIIDEAEYFNYIDSKSVVRITYLAPSVMIFNGAFNMQRVFSCDGGVSEEFDADDEIMKQKFANQNSTITINQYIELMRGNMKKFSNRPDFYIIYQKMEEMNHILQFLVENNLFDLIEAQFNQEEQEKPIQEQICFLKIDEIVPQQQKSKQYDSKDYIPRRVDLSQLSNISLNLFTPLLENLKKIIEQLAIKLNGVIIQGERLSHQLFDIPFTVSDNKYKEEAKNSMQQLIGINKSVYDHTKGITFFAIKNQLYISKNQQMFLLNNVSNIDLKQYSDIQFIAKLPQVNDNRIHLIVAFKIEKGIFSQKSNLENSIYHLLFEENGSKFSIVRKIIEYPNKDVTNISVLTDQNEILVQYKDSTLQLLYAKKQQNHPAEVMHTWNDVYCATFTMIGTILICFSNKITEFMALQLEKKHEIFERNSKDFQKIGFNQSVKKVNHLFQYNSSTFLAVCQTQNSLIAYPVFIGSLCAIQNNDILNYSISLKNIDIMNQSQIEVKASYCSVLKQIFLTHNASNQVFVFPISLNKAVHKPQILEFNMDGLEKINGFVKTNQDLDSSTYSIYDLKLGRGKQVIFKKNKECFLSFLD